MKASITRNDISGINYVNDIPDGEYGIQDLGRLAQKQTDALNAANKAGQADGFTEQNNPGLGDAMSKEPRPSTVGKANESDRYGTI